MTYEQWINNARTGLHGDPDKWWTVYRVLNADNEVIYVGMTGDFPRRKSEHMASTPGAAEVRFAYIYPDDKHLATVTESALIDIERPTLNVAGNSRRGHPETTDQRIARLTAMIVRDRESSVHHLRWADAQPSESQVIERLTAELAECRSTMVAMAAGLTVAAELVGRAA